jgi:hypothetical protein
MNLGETSQGRSALMYVISNFVLRLARGSWFGSELAMTERMGGERSSATAIARFRFGSLNGSPR